MLHKQVRHLADALSSVTSSNILVAVPPSSPCHPERSEAKPNAVESLP